MTIIIVTMAERFEIIYAPLTKLHLRAIDSNHYSLIRHEIENQLGLEPDVETRNRKPLKRPILFGAVWEIRFGPRNRFRVFYRVNRGEKQVEVLAIGEKKGNCLFVGGEEIKL